MATTLLNLDGGAGNTARASNDETWHRFRLRLAWLAAIVSVAAISVYGFSYYRLSLEQRPFSPLHGLLKPSGSVGLRLGMIGLGLYCILFLYPVRKRVKWLGKIGKTRHWLDFHVLIGVLAPVLITFHASFKLAGIAGVAYWIMIAVALSGFIGRYIYAQIPRSLNAVELTMGELASQVTELAAQLARQHLFQAGDLASLLLVPSPDEVRAMPLSEMLWTILRLDLTRPVLIARLRRRVLRRLGFDCHARRTVGLPGSRPGDGDYGRPAAGCAASKDGVPGPDRANLPLVARDPSAVQLFVRRVGVDPRGGGAHDGILLKSAAWKHFSRF